MDNRFKILSNLCINYIRPKVKSGFSYEAIAPEILASIVILISRGTMTVKNARYVINKIYELEYSKK